MRSQLIVIIFYLDLKDAVRLNNVLGSLMTRDVSSNARKLSSTFYTTVDKKSPKGHQLEKN